MQESFCIRVSSITKKEYMQAGTEVLNRMLLPLLGMVAVVTTILCLALDDFSTKAILPPFILAMLGMVAFWAMIAASWKKFPADTAYTLSFDEAAWELTLGEESFRVEWVDTPRLTLRSRAILLYNDGSRSNLLPRRCVSAEQLALIQGWYKVSRPEYKELARAKEEKQRAEYRSRRARERQNSRFHRGRGNHL